MFAFAFVKNKPGKPVSSLVGSLLLFLKIYVLKIEQNIKATEKYFSTLNSSVPSQIEHRVAVFSKTFYRPRQRKNPSRSPLISQEVKCD